MKHNYSPITFTPDADENVELLANRDYHTLCVIHDAFGSTHPMTLATMTLRGETFTINPAWDTCMGSEWYRNASQALYPACNCDACQHGDGH